MSEETAAPVAPFLLPMHAPTRAGGPDADCDVEHAALCVRRSEGERQPQKGRAADQRAAEREGRVVVDHGSHDGLDDGADRLAVLGLVHGERGHEPHDDAVDVRAPLEHRARIGFSWPELGQPRNLLYTPLG